MAAKRPNAAAAAGAAKAAAAPKGKADAGSGQPPAKKAKNSPAANGTAEPQKQHVEAPAAQQEQATVGPSSAAAAAKAALLKQRLFKHQKGKVSQEQQHAADGVEQQPGGSAPKQQERAAGKAKWQNKKKQAGKQQEKQPAQAAKVPAATSDIPAGPAGAAAAAAAATAGTVAVHNKERVLVLTTRGITFRYRHLMEDLVALLPHSKKDVKLDTKSDRGVINEVADLKGCSSVLFFEARKRQDLYLWMAKSPAGPSVKFLVNNVHTMAEVKLAGNHLKGSRPVLSFHRAFDEQPHLQLLKEMLTQVFATPRRHHKGKPFFDHVLSFAVADGRIWMRNYQVVVPLEKKKADVDNTSLIEVGPRFCLNPIKIFSGSFGGAVLYENTNYVSPNALRAAAKRAAAAKYVNRVEQRQQRKQHEAEHQMPRDPLEGLFKGDGEEEDGGSE